VSYQWEQEDPSSLKFSSSTEKKNHSPSPHKEPDIKQSGDSTLPSFVIEF